MSTLRYLTVDELVERLKPLSRSELMRVYDIVEQLGYLGHLGLSTVKEVCEDLIERESGLEPEQR